MKLSIFDSESAELFWFGSSRERLQVNNVLEVSFLPILIGSAATEKTHRERKRRDRLRDLART
jgi:hypothetical protein